jgi:hypothetical protein
MIVVPLGSKPGLSVWFDRRAPGRRVMYPARSIQEVKGRVRMSKRHWRVVSKPWYQAGVCT